MIGVVSLVWHQDLSEVQQYHFCTRVAVKTFVRCDGVLILSGHHFEIMKLN